MCITNTSFNVGQNKLCFLNTLQIYNLSIYLEILILLNKFKYKTI